MCRKYHLYYSSCGHTEDDLFYLCPEASRLGRPCQHPIRLGSPRARERLCPDCRPAPENWPLTTGTAIGYMIMNFPWIVWLLIYGTYSMVCFVVQEVRRLFQTLCRFLRSALQWLSSSIRTLSAALSYHASRLAILTKLIVHTYLWTAVKSFLWWTLAIAFTPFIAVLAILEILENGLWPHVPKLLWKLVDFCTGDTFQLWAGIFLADAYFVAPASSATRWLEKIANVLAPFQVAKLYTWYRYEAWDRLGDFWATFTLAAVTTSVLTALFVTAQHASVLSLLNLWVYAIVSFLTIAALTRSFLSLLFAYARKALEALVPWLYGLIGNRPAPASHDGAAQPEKVEEPRIGRAPAYQDSTVHMGNVDSTVQTGNVAVRRNRAAHKLRDSPGQAGRENVRYTGQNRVRWRRGSYERKRPT